LILPLVDPWLDACSTNGLTCTAKAFVPNQQKYWFLPIILPGTPATRYKRRKRGFGRPKIGLSTSHDKPGYEIIGHHIWEFIDNDDRANLAKLPGSDNIFSEYASLRLSAYQNRHAILQLQQQRPSLDEIPPLSCPRRARTCGEALLSFNFVYGDFARWVGGEYTTSHRSWKQFEDDVERYHNVPLVPNQPPIDCDRLLAISTGMVSHYKAPSDANALTC
jgi:hypothetical protein